MSRRTLDRLLEGCQIIGPDYRYLYVNDTLVRQGRQSKEALLQMTMPEAYPGIEATPVFAAIRRVMDGGPAEHFDNFFEFPGGESGWFELSIQPVPDGVCVLSIDITERVQAQRLANRQQRLESLGTLAGGVAHDLNNALAPILMSIGLLRDTGLADEELLATIEESTARAARLIRHLLTFSKGADGPLSPLWPQAVVKDIERFIKRAFPKTIRTEYHVDHHLPPVLGDVTQLGQVLLNLCINARDAMPDGGVLTIEASLTHVDAAYASAVLGGRIGTFVTFTVRDTGGGIPPEVLDRIFEPFFTTKGPEVGTGLGLSTSLGIVRGHGGFIHVYSHLGTGTTFKVYIPVADNPHRGTDPVANGATGIDGDGRTILVVDDDPRTRETAAGVLHSLDFVVVTAADGADGLLRLAEHGEAIALVLLDLHMPSLDGRSFHDHLTAAAPSLPVVIMSGRLPEREAAPENGAPRLAKPFTRAELVAALRAALG